MGQDPLTEWSPSATKEAIIDFVTAAVALGDNQVAPVERIATFDNDGTLWCEKPMYVQAAFIFSKWHRMVLDDPSLASQQPYKALVDGDLAWLSAILDHVPELVKGIGEAFGGISTDAFEREVSDFFAQARHPSLDRSYDSLGFVPMIQLLDYLRANEFRVFICSGGGRDFVRVVSEQMYGINREKVIGTSSPVEYRDGQLWRTAGIELPIDDGPGKPAHIWARTGRRPLFAAGNADGDIEMLSLASFSLLVDHDDEGREFAYRSGAENALTTAGARGWTVASMANDFATVFQAH